MCSTWCCIQKNNVHEWVRSKRIEWACWFCTMAMAMPFNCIVYLYTFRKSVLIRYVERLKLVEAWKWTFKIQDLDLTFQRINKPFGDYDLERVYKVDVRDYWRVFHLIRLILPICTLFSVSNVILTFHIIFSLLLQFIFVMNNN